MEDSGRWVNYELTQGVSGIVHSEVKKQKTYRVYNFLNNGLVRKA